MERQLLTALLDLRIAIGELQASMIDVEKAARELMAAILEVQQEHPKPDDSPPEPT